MCIPHHERLGGAITMTVKNPILEQLEQLRSARDTARDAAIAMAAEDTFDAEDQSFKDLEARATGLDTQIGRLAGLLEAQKSADALDGRLSRSPQVPEQRSEAPQSWGEQFINSDVFKEFGDRSLRGTSGKFEVEQRALPHSLVTMDAALPANPIYNLTPAPLPPMLIPLTSVIPVSSNSVEYITWKKKAGGAAVVGEGLAKPEVEWEPTVVPASLDNIAGRTSFTRQLAEDAPAVVAYINGELQADVTRKAEIEAKAALVAATLPALTGPAGAGVSGAIRAGKAAVVNAGYAPNAFLIHSDDLVALDLESVTNFRGDPYWGMTPVVDPNATAGTVIVGDFKAGVAHYRRSAVALYMTDSHASNFALNILDALAEQRSKTVVVRPAALVEATAGA
jgi:HK97 family phage major capsid protein